MATIRAYVYKDEGFFDSYKVYPPVVVLGNGDKFELVNTVDGHDAVWTVPGDPFQGGTITDKHIAPHKKSGEKTPKSSQDAIAFEYKVKVDGHDAHAHSDPVIIIDP
jgi:hypothetical protein